MATYTPGDGSLTVENAMLHQWPLPMPPAEGDKEVRGHVLILGGSTMSPTPCASPSR